jgi:hypothetical protein
MVLTRSAEKKKQSLTVARQQQSRQLRSRSTGVGISIGSIAENQDKNNQSKNRKTTVFEDIDSPVQYEDEHRIYSIPENQNAGKKLFDNDNDEADKNDDTSDVEEVSGTLAKDQALEQMAKETETAVKCSLTKPRKRKKKEKSHQEEKHEMFDDEFFQQLEHERSEQRKQRKLSAKLSQNNQQKTGKHTKFSLNDGATTFETKKLEEHNIEVAVLGTYSSDGNSVRNYLLDCSEPPTESTLLYSRSLLVDGTVPLSARQLQKAKKAGHKNLNEAATTWKRSKKMNRLGVNPAAKRKQSPAVHFCPSKA